MHGAFALVHPLPDLFAGEGQEGGKEAVECVQHQPQGGPGAQYLGLVRGPSGGLRRSVGAVLGQLNVVVAEVPEEGFHRFQGLGVLVVIEGLGGLVNHPGKSGQNRAIQGNGHIRGVPSSLGGLAHMMVFVLTTYGQGELGGVEQFDGQTAADLHLPLVVGGIQSESGR